MRARQSWYRAYVLFAFIGSLVSFTSAAPLTRSNYTLQAKTHGVVLLDVDWGRYWSCGGNENAQLMEIGFDRLPLAEVGSDKPPAELLEGSMISLFEKKGLQNRALLVEPGEYALTRFSIRVARSVSDVGFQQASRAQLLKDGRPIAGTFRVAAGEVVYIGNFKLECSPPMALWRFYTVGKSGFAKHMQEYKASFPFADLDNVQYRLFDTVTMGLPYELK